jgi:acyl-ACP thioesterase
MLSTRDFRIYITDKDGVRRQIGECTSQWAVLDMDKREIVNIFDRPMFEGAIDGEKLDIPRAPRLLPITEPTGVVSHIVQYTDVDYNDHCNSCKYLAAMVNAAKPDYLGKRVRLDINYQREARLGEQIDTLYLELPDGIQYQQKNVNGETSCAAKITILA